MKKLIFAAFAVLASSSVVAQDYPGEGDISTEIQFNPFSADFNTFRLNGAKLKGTYFLSEVDGIRFGLGFGYDRKSNRADLSIPQRDSYTTQSSFDYAMDVYNLRKDDYQSKANTNFALSVGYERHFKTVDRLDLYVGGEISFGITAMNSYSETNNYENAYNNGSYSYIKDKWIDTQSTKSNNVQIGAGLFTGVNYYVYKSLYLGAELGLSLGYSGDGNKHSKWTTGNPNASKKEGETETFVRNNTFSAKVYCDPSLHLGWTF